jgi:hypothetical protein
LKSPLVLFSKGGKGEHGGSSLFIEWGFSPSKHRKGFSMKKAIFPVVLFLSVALSLVFALTTFAGRTAGVAVDDATITTKVKYELAEDVKFSTLKTVQVDTHRGEVTLTGKVHTQQEKKHAGVVTQKVKGVVKVHNMLSIVPEQ